ncbi:DUF433 domain-containing protein [Candidatus Poribacteria bacterium]|nr:DUF433 domain-containing protein [Candidatus Poribacteria bacterium]
MSTRRKMGSKPQKKLAALKIKKEPWLGYERTEFPHIVKAEVLSEAEPVITGTRIPVYSIISALMNGSSMDGLQKRYPEVPRQAILDAIHYYLHHQDELDRRLEREEAGDINACASQTGETSA